MKNIPTKFVILTLGLIITFSETSEGKGGTNEISIRNTFTAEPIVKLLRSESIQRLEIFYINVNSDSVAPVLPEDLERIFDLKICIRDGSKSKIYNELTSALEKSAIVKIDSAPDIRWGCVFYDAKDRRVLTIYFDGHFGKGLINGQPVRSCEKIVKVLENRCSQIWE